MAIYWFEWTYIVVIDPNSFGLVFNWKEQKFMSCLELFSGDDQGFTKFSSRIIRVCNGCKVLNSVQLSISGWRWHCIQYRLPWFSHYKIVPRNESRIFLSVPSRSLPVKRKNIYLKKLQVFALRGKTILEWIGYGRFFTKNKQPAL